MERGNIPRGFVLEGLLDLAPTEQWEQLRLLGLRPLFEESV